ncbi:zinc finger, CCHC-type containing protein, partial [Tanacetum coccineum]
DDDVAWWVDLGETVHVCKDRCWFKTYESLNDGSILHMEYESTALVHGRGCVDLRFSSGKIVSLFNVLHVLNIRKNLVSSSVLNNYGYKQVIESNKFVLSKLGVFIGFGYLSNQMFRLNIVNNNIASVFMSTSKLNDSILWHVRLGHVHFKRIRDMSKDGLIPAFDMDTEKCQTCMLTKITKKLFQNVKRETKVLELIHRLSQGFWGEAMTVVRLPDPKLKTLDERGIECIFVGYVKHSKSFRFYVIEPNDSVSINSIIESKDAIFDENKILSVPRPSLRIPNGTEYIGGLLVTEEVVQQPEPELRKSKRNRTPKDFGPEFPLYLIERTRDDVSDQHSYCFNVEDEPKTFDGAMKSQDVAFWKEAISDEMDSIMVARISTIRMLIAMALIHNLVIHQMDVKTTFLNGDLDEEVYMNQPQGFSMPFNENKVCKLIKSLYGLKQAPKQWHQKFDKVVLSNGYSLNQADKCVDMTKEFLSSRFSMKDMGEADVIFVSTPMDTSEKLMPNNGQAVSQLEYSRVIGYMMYAMTCTRPDIAFVVGKLSSLTYTGYPLVLEGYTDASWISNTGDNSSISGWVFLLGGGAISWTSKKQTCITGSIMKSEFVALAAAGKEAEWLRNLILKIPLWSKPISPISIRCDSAATLAKAYSQIYKGKSRHLGVRHNMIRELITNGVDPT